MTGCHFKPDSAITGVTIGGTANAPRAMIGPLDVSVRDLDTGLSDRWQFGIFVVVVLMLVAYAVARVRSGRTGRRFLAVRSNERAAAACGHAAGSASTEVWAESHCRPGVLLGGMGDACR